LSSPKYNAKPATAVHGQDLATQATAILFSMRGDDGAMERGMNRHFQEGGWDMMNN
ncbi:hypothetical protein SERLA73DRAFT_139085, partial [Serpula lacrymans var. lacrymans S7.3]